MLRMLLRTYLDMHHETVAGFAAKIEVREAAIYRYLAGRRVPKPQVMTRIIAVTKAAVTANDFHQLTAAVGCPDSPVRTARPAGNGSAP